MDAEDANGDGEEDHRLRLTHDGPSIMSDCPVFSPDGTRIAYGNNSSGNFDIYFVDSSGLNKTLFARYGQSCFVSDWK
jgi:Tol biopolymer transport system component